MHRIPTLRQDSSGPFIQGITRMRENLPVTQKEFPLPTDQHIVSATDVKGRIVYCNPT